LKTISDSKVIQLSGGSKWGEQVREQVGEQVQGGSGNNPPDPIKVQEPGARAGEAYLKVSKDFSIPPRYIGEQRSVPPVVAP